MKTAQEVALAVIPFVDLSAAPAIDALSSEITEHVGRALRLGEILRVITPTLLCDGDTCIAHLGRRLRADWLLFGCVCRRTGTWYAHTQLIHAPTGRVVSCAETEQRVWGTPADDLGTKIAGEVESALEVHAVRRA